MLKYLLLSILLTIQINSNSQELKVNDLVQLRIKEASDIETYLTNKNWEFASSGEETETKPAIIAFSKNIAKKDHIFQFVYSTSDSFSRILYTFFDKTTYLKTTSDALKNGFILKKNITKNDALIKVYYKKGNYLILNNFKIEDKNKNLINMFRVDIYGEKDFKNSNPLD